MVHYDLLFCRSTLAKFAEISEFLVSNFMMDYFVEPDITFCSTRDSEHSTVLNDVRPTETDGYLLNVPKRSLTTVFLRLDRILSSKLHLRLAFYEWLCITLVASSKSENMSLSARKRRRNADEDASDLGPCINLETATKSQTPMKSSSFRKSLFGATPNNVSVTPQFAKITPKFPLSSFSPAYGKENLPPNGNTTTPVVSRSQSTLDESFLEISQKLKGIEDHVKSLSLSSTPSVIPSTPSPSSKSAIIQSKVSVWRQKYVV